MYCYKQLYIAIIINAMPVIKSAGKKLKQSLVHRDRNRLVRSRLRDLIVDFRKGPTLLRLSKLMSSLDKAAKKNVIHANKAARIKGRMAKLIKKKKA